MVTLNHTRSTVFSLGQHSLGRMSIKWKESSIGQWIVWDLETISYEERLKELGISVLEKRYL